jgi:molybdopterin-containing oxidoreductase family membrane subunit
MSESRSGTAKAFPVLRGQHDYRSMTDHVCDIVQVRPAGKAWYAGLVLALILVALLITAIGYLFAKGVGIWGLNIPVAWGFAITNYVWWIGIGMAGTFISGALLLLRQPWRTSINRAAETMTVMAVAIAGLFPILHLGRPWFAYWLAPYPNTMNLWPQWRSSLVWDFGAILVYLIVSLLIWYLSLIPDLATLRDRARSRIGQLFYGLTALGWRGDARHWQRHETVTRILAGLAVPLVFSVHSMVALDFSIGDTPGWHSTIFPPFFVAGALYSGFALVLVLSIPLRAIYGLQDFITDRHLESMAKALLAAGLVVAYSYLVEAFIAWYSGNPYEIYLELNRVSGPYAPVYWSTIMCNALIPQALWFRRVRLNHTALVLISLVVLVGMWLERFVIVIISLHREYIPSQWDMFYPTFWDWAILIGSIGLFLLFLLLFVRLLPVLSMHELRKLIRQMEGKQDEQAQGEAGHG